MTELDYHHFIAPNGQPDLGIEALIAANITKIVRVSCWRDIPLLMKLSYKNKQMNKKEQKNPESDQASNCNYQFTRL